MFIKTKKNRDFLKRFCDSDDFPNVKNINFEREPNMIHIQKMCDDLKQLGHRSLPTETRKIFHDFSSQSSTIHLVQVAEIDTLENLSIFLKGNHQILKDRETRDLKNECIKKFPVLYSRLKTFIKHDACLWKYPGWNQISVCCSD